MKKRKRPFVDVDLLLENGQMTRLKFNYNAEAMLEEELPEPPSDASFAPISHRIIYALQQGRERSVRRTLLRAGMSHKGNTPTPEFAGKIIDDYLSKTSDNPNDALLKLDKKIGEALVLAGIMRYNFFDPEELARQTEDDPEAEEPETETGPPEEGGQDDDEEDESRPPS